MRNYRVIDSVYSLFQYEQTLIPAELTLRRLKDFLGSTWYPLVLDKIKNAMGLDSSVSIDLPKGGGVRISGETVWTRHSTRRLGGRLQEDVGMDS